MEKIPYVVTIAAQKGGVGKSTIACNLAVCLANENYRVELIDADTQESAMIFRNIRSDKGIDDFVASANTTKTIFNDINKKQGYDVIIIDSGGRDTSVMRSAVLSARYGVLIIPFTPSQFDFSSLTDTLQILKEARGLDENIKAYVLYNRVDERKKITQEAREDLRALQEDYNFEILEAVLANRNDYITSIIQGQGVIEYKSRDNKAKNEMLTLYEEIKRILDIKKGVSR